MHKAHEEGAVASVEDDDEQAAAQFEATIAEHTCVWSELPHQACTICGRRWVDAQIEVVNLLKEAFNHHE